jgi:hypothetical protein
MTVRQAQGERNTRLPGRRGSGLAFPALVIALLAAVAIFHVWARTRVLSAGYELGVLQKQHAQLQERNDALHIELSMLTAPAALERALHAKLSKLGMALPLQGEVLAAGPRRPRDGVGRAGGDGVGDPSRPAGPALPSRPAKASRRAAAAGLGSDPGPLAFVNADDRGSLQAGWGPDELRAGLAPPREP